MGEVTTTKGANCMSNILKSEQVDIDTLKPHKENYRQHPDDQLEHICQSIKENGIYRNIIVANDNTILAGHGVVQACKKMGIKKVPVVKVPVSPDSPQAKKILIGDNQISHLAEIDDRLLSDMLKDIKDNDFTGLLGTGFDENMLAALAMVTRPASEIKDINEAKEWVGVTDYEEGDGQFRIVIICDSKESGEELLKKLEISNVRKGENTWSFRYPNNKNDDPGALVVEENCETA